MPTYDAEANRRLTDIVSRGGSWWVGVTTTLPGPDPSTITEGPVARVEIPLNGAASWVLPATSRAVSPVADVSFAPVGTDFSVQGYAVWDAATGGTLLCSARLASVTDPDGALVPAGASFRLPADSLVLTHD